MYISKEQYIEVVDGVEYLFIEYMNGMKTWWVGKDKDIPHRECGPAMIQADGRKNWYLNGNKISEKEFNRRRAIKRIKRL